MSMTVASDGRFSLRLVLFVALLLFLTSCSWSSSERPGRQGPGISPGRGQTGSEFDAAAFVGGLAKQALPVKFVPVASEPFFTGHTIGLKVGRDVVRVFEYPSAAAMQRAAVGVSPDGYQVESGRSAVALEWVAPPHFFKRGRIVVLVLGADSPLLTAIQQVMGPQFAGS